MSIRFSAPTASTRTLLGCVLRDDLGGVREHDVDLVAEEGGELRARGRERHLTDLDALGLLQLAQRQGLRGAGAAVAEADRVRVLLRGVDDVVQGLEGAVGAADQAPGSLTKLAIG